MHKSIAIITDDPEGFMALPYLIHFLANDWARQGHSVIVSSPDQAPDADIAVLHVDLTIVPESLVSACEKYPQVLNGRFTDNSKRVFSRQLIGPEAEYNGKVIVKTNANYGGLHELILKYGPTAPPNVVADFSAAAIRWEVVESIPSDQYLVLESRHEVPSAVWGNPHLVVEKFMPEIYDTGLYCMRACIFFGDREANILVKSPSKVVKGTDAVDRQLLTDKAPAAVQHFKREHGMDFGRIDYVIHEGEVVIFDANKTATPEPSGKRGMGGLSGHTARARS
jgi:hypothetical protein